MGSWGNPNFLTTKSLTLNGRVHSCPRVFAALIFKANLQSCNTIATAQSVLILFDRMPTLCNDLATVHTNRVTQIMPVFFFDQRVNGPGVYNTALAVYNSVHAQEKNVAKSVPSNKTLAPRVWQCQHHRPDDSQIIQGKFVTPIHKLQCSLHGKKRSHNTLCKIFLHLTGHQR